MSCHLLNPFCNYRDTGRWLCDGPSARARMRGLVLSSTAWAHLMVTTRHAMQRAMQCNHSIGVLAPCLVSGQGCAVRGKLSPVYTTTHMPATAPPAASVSLAGDDCCRFTLHSASVGLAHQLPGPPCLSPGSALLGHAGWSPGLLAGWLGTRGCTSARHSEPLLLLILLAKQTKLTAGRNADSSPISWFLATKLVRVVRNT